MKKIYSLIILILVFTNYSSSQSLCNLIDSISLSVPNVNKVGLYGANPQGVPNSINNHSIPLDTNNWEYITLTKDGNNNSKIYKNGQLVYQGKYMNLSYNWNRLELGAVFYTSYNGWYNGLIDEVRLSNKVRTDSEIMNYYNSNTPFTSDANTIGLWNFDQNSGSTINATTGQIGAGTNINWESQGKFGQCLSFNGLNSRARFNQSIPTTNMTFEFWMKTNKLQDSWMVSFYGGNTSGFVINKDTVETKYIWSTGDTSNTIKINPKDYSKIWVTDGNCTDTVWFDSKNIRNVSVTDTLLINITASNINPPNNKNIIKVYPNPTKSMITIDNGDATLMNGYSIKIINSLGQQLYQNSINQKLNTIDITQWGGSGIYYLQVIDSNGNIIEIKKIILQ